MTFDFFGGDRLPVMPLVRDEFEIPRVDLDEIRAAEEEHESGRRVGTDAVDAEQLLAEFASGQGRGLERFKIELP